jgi:hypothetical protein
MRGKTLLIGMVGIVIGVLLSTAVVLAGSLNPTAGPGDAASQMYTLQQVWDRINNGAAATKMTAFTEPSSGPAATGKTLDELYTLAGERSRPALTGQRTGYGPGDDGSWPRGVASPNPRFTDNGNGTVTDNLTGLIWLKNANCFNTRDWVNALYSANALNSGECGLSDGSLEGAWRLPNVREQQSLIDYGNWNPALPTAATHLFTGVRSGDGDYWTSTTHGAGPYDAYYVTVRNGTVNFQFKSNTFYVWPVRGGQ